MLYIFMALYAEAVPFIAQMKLKRVNDSGKFVLYQDEAGEAILAVTGPGKVEAAEVRRERQTVLMSMCNRPSDQS